MRADALVPSDRTEVTELCAKITGKEKNAYNKAKLIYNYMCDNITNLDLYALNYFNTRISYREMFKSIDNIAKSLCNELGTAI